VTSSEDGAARVWDIESEAELVALTGHAGSVVHAAWNAAGTHIVTASDDGTARMWAVGSGTEVFILEGHTGRVNHVAWSPDGMRIVTASSDGMARVWDAESGDVLTILEGHTDWVRHAAWSPDGTRVVTAGCDEAVDLGYCSAGTIRVWDAESGEELTVLATHTGPVWYAAWSPNGTRLVTSGCDQVEFAAGGGCSVSTTRVWDADSGDELIALGFPAEHVAWSPDGTHIVTVSELYGTAQVWDIEDGAELVILESHTDWIWRTAWSPDGTHIVTTSDDGTPRVWNIESGEELIALTPHTSPVRCVAWSPDGTHIVTASDDGTARVWDVKDGTELVILEGHTDWIWHTAWSPDGTHIVTASDDGTARVWDKSGAEVAILPDSTYAAWSPDGTRIATIVRDMHEPQDDPYGIRGFPLSGNTVRVYDYALIEDLPEAICQFAVRNMSENEWQQYIGKDRPYRETCPGKPVPGRDY
jgi:WD40 repeat protein